MSEPGTAPWRRAEASRLITFARAAALAGGGFGWLDTRGRVDVTKPCPLYVNARMTHAFALAHLNGVTGADSLAASGLAALASRYADRENGGWFSAIDVSGTVTDSAKTNYDHAHALLAASSAVAAGIPGAGGALTAAAAAIDAHFWSDAEGCALESWNAGFSEPEPYRGANSNMHSVEAYLAAGDVTGNAVWPRRALSIATRLIDDHARAHGWRIPEHYDENWRPLPDYNLHHRDHPFRPYGTTPGHSFEWARLLVDLEAALPAPPAGWPGRRPRCSTGPPPTRGSGTATRDCSTPSTPPASRWSPRACTGSPARRFWPPTPCTGGPVRNASPRRHSGGGPRSTASSWTGKTAAGSRSWPRT